MFLKKKCMPFILGILLFGGGDCFAWDQIELSVSMSDNGTFPINPSHGKFPVLAPSIWQDGYQIGFPSEHAEYTIELVQEGTVVYTALVPESTTSIMLPSWLEGEFELHLIPADSSYYFFGYISL